MSLYAKENHYTLLGASAPGTGKGNNYVVVEMRAMEPSHSVRKKKKYSTKYPRSHKSKLYFQFFVLFVVSGYPQRGCTLHTSVSHQPNPPLGGSSSEDSLSLPRNGAFAGTDPSAPPPEHQPPHRLHRRCPRREQAFAKSALAPSYRSLFRWLPGLDGREPR